MADQLLTRLNHYLIGYSSLRDLETWLLANLQGILDSKDERAIEMANQVDADLVELGEGLIDEAALRERLESCVRQMETILLDFHETARLATVEATAEAMTFKNQMEVPLPGHVLDLHLDHKFV